MWLIQTNYDLKQRGERHLDSTIKPFMCFGGSEEREEALSGVS